MMPRKEFPFSGPILTSMLYTLLQMFTHFCLFIMQNAYPTPTSASIFDFYGIKTLWFEFGNDIQGRNRWEILDATSAMVGRICPPPPDRNRVKVSENLGATSVAPVAPVVTSLISSLATKCQHFKLRGLQFHYIKWLSNSTSESWHFEASEDIITKFKSPTN